MKWPPSVLNACRRAPALAALALVVSSLGCERPDQTLVGCWRQVDWRYERMDEPLQRWFDGVRLRAYPDRDLVVHEAERWDVGPRGAVRIARRDGEAQGRWRLKGRGHVLTLRFASSESETFEVYDVKELDARRLELNYDIGVEARGVARLSFERAPARACVAPSPEGRS